MANVWQMCADVYILIQTLFKRKKGHLFHIVQTRFRIDLIISFYIN